MTLTALHTTIITAAKIMLFIISSFSGGLHCLLCYYMLLLNHCYITDTYTFYVRELVLTNLCNQYTLLSFKNQYHICGTQVSDPNVPNAGTLGSDTCVPALKKRRNRHSAGTTFLYQQLILQPLFIHLIFLLILLLLALLS